jgi:lysyl-tRNA synthetase class 2
MTIILTFTDFGILYAMDQRISKLTIMREQKIEPYPYRFDRTHTFSDIRKNFETLSQDGNIIKSCGRVFTIRGHGKTIFATLVDEEETLQVYLRKDELKTKFDVFKLFDIGDFMGMTGTVFKTKTGEITILVQDFVILSKALRPLPEKWHGLKDVEIRYRKRYLDLIANTEVRTIFKKRAQLITLMRQFLDNRGFIEMETPVLQPIYGGGTANPFKTYYSALDQHMYLRIADELYLKRLIIGGYEKVYEICKDFRNEGIDRFHNPEFTMAEVYQAYTDYLGIMDLVESLLAFLMERMLGSSTVRFTNREASFDKPFKRIKYVDSLNSKLGFDILAADTADINRACRDIAVDPGQLSCGAKIDKLFAEYVQKLLVEPTFVMDYPKIISPLAKQHRDDDRLVERFELVAFGIELANAFSELNDPKEQRARFEEQLAHKEEGISEIDEDFIEALEYGMPPTGGLGIGIDRLCMVLFDLPSLRDVILFPQLRNL